MSTVIGRLRTRTPVAWNTALATAAPVPTMPISPKTFHTQVVGHLRIRLVHEDHLDVLDVGVGGDVVFGEVVVHEAADPRGR